ncbi:hypothetical protein C5167_016254 [Papaver somniferum]|nr:hypothetical protein C5167_016254 [Papaver somniferum]
MVDYQSSGYDEYDRMMYDQEENHMMRKRLRCSSPDTVLLPKENKISNGYIGDGGEEEGYQESAPKRFIANNQHCGSHDQHGGGGDLGEEGGVPVNEQERFIPNHQQSGSHDQDGGGGGQEEDGGGIGNDQQRVLLPVNPTLPSGFFFSPSDVQLLKFLNLKINDPAGFKFKFIPDVDVYKFHPEELCRGSEKLFFTFLEKYGKDGRTTRLVPGIGCWHLSGKTYQVGNGNGKKRGLCFRIGISSDYITTSWQLKEYYFEDPNQSTLWVLCKVYHKNFTKDDTEDPNSDLIFDSSHLI